PPPGAGVKTVTLGVPAAAMSAAGMLAVSCVDETNVVGRSAPFSRTTELAVKLEPAAVRVKAAPPAATAAGVMLLSAGTGLLTARVAGDGVPPPGGGVETVTPSAPGKAMSLARMAAVSWVADTKVVVRLDPPTCTTELGVKPVPFTVRVNPDPPTTAEAGLR